MPNSTTNSGIELSSLLGVAFIVLKLCKVIDWPWIWVVAPFWIGLAALLFVLMVGGLMIVIGFIIGKIANR